MTEDNPSEPGLQPGDLAIIPYPRVREQLGCGEEVGLVLEDRRHVVKVYLPVMDRVFWLEYGVLQRVPVDRLPLDPLVEALHRAGALIHVDEIEIFDGTMRNGIVHLYSRGAPWPAFVKAREHLGGQVTEAHIEPANMRHLRLRLTLDPH